jgi:hypothetical protein
MLAFFRLQPVAFAGGPGSVAPPISLENLAGRTVDLAAPRDNTLQILLFSDPSSIGSAMLGRLNSAAAKSSGAVSAFGIFNGSPEEVRSILVDADGLDSIALVDNRRKKVASAFGVERRLPAAVIVGPGGRIIAKFAPADAPGIILSATADAFISLRRPDRARLIYEILLSDYSDQENAAVGAAYAALLTGDVEAARRMLESLSATSGPSEANVARGFLEFTIGRDSAARAACDREQNSGFADYVMGMVAARSGRCEEAMSLFAKAPKGRFMFRWQKALAINMAARAAETHGGTDTDAVVAAYHKAASFAPLNPTINGNLLAYHWRNGANQAAAKYARLIASVGSSSALVNSVVAEFEAQKQFRGDAAARKRLAKSLGVGSARKTSGGSARPRTERRILIPDIEFTGCVQELSSTPLAAAGLLRRSLESGEGFVAVPRAEMLFAADHLGVPRQGLRKSGLLLKVARALSAGLVTLSEVGSHGGEYFVNVRIAEVGSGEVVAVASERFMTLDELAPAIQRLGSRLKGKMKTSPGG